MDGKKNKRLGQERETRLGLETHLRLKLQVCFFFLKCFLLLVFKSPVKSGYWVPNMVTKTLTG